METLSRVISTILVACIGMAFVLVALTGLVYVVLPKQPTPTPAYYTCPYCQRKFDADPVRPGRPPEVMPTPNYPHRPGNVDTGSKGEKK